MRHRLGDRERRTFQLWLGLNGVEDVTFAYPGGRPPQIPAGQPVTIGVENSDGTQGEVDTGGRAGDRRVTTVAARPGGLTPPPGQLWGPGGRQPDGDRDRHLPRRQLGQCPPDPDPGPPKRSPKWSNNGSGIFVPYWCGIACFEPKSVVK